MNKQVERGQATLAWACVTFGPCAVRREERAMRLLEEAMELAQGEGVTLEVARRLSERVWSRPPGATAKEVGQVQTCLEALAVNIGLDPDAEANAERERCLALPASHWKARHDIKTAAGLTTGE